LTEGSKLKATATTKKLREIAQRWIQEGWQKGNVGMVNELHAENFIDRSSAGRLTNREGFKTGIAALYVAFPDFSAVIEDMIIDPALGKVAVRWTATGTHKGKFMNILPTGKRIYFTGIEIIRIANERIVERWGEWNGNELLEQLEEVKK
jgi:steroid delta-isomerase-like uncharacterized protein